MFFLVPLGVLEIHGATPSHQAILVLKPAQATSLSFAKVPMRWRPWAPKKEMVVTLKVAANSLCGILWEKRVPCMSTLDGVAMPCAPFPRYLRVVIIFVQIGGDKLSSHIS